MIKALLAAVLLCAASVYAAPPVLSCTPSRTSGVAPLFVLLDCTPTTDADLPDTGNNINRAFREIEYRHNFGDPNAGLWGYGANTTLSKNQATGAIAGHIFETPGTYTITTVGGDGTSTRRVTNVITVTDPEVVFTGAATVCIANVTAQQGQEGCPKDAATPTGTVDLPATIAANCNAATKRCLLKRGDTFTATSALTISSAGAITLGAYGTGAKPIITASANINAILLNNAAINDLRLMDLDVRTQSTGIGVSVSVSATMTRVTMLRVTLGPNAQGSIVVGGTVTMTETVVQDSVLGPNQGTAPGGVTLFGRFVSSAILGNSIGPSEGQHVIRFVKFQKSVFANNTAGDAPLNETVLTIRAVEHVTADDDSYYFIVSDNDLFTGDRTNSLLAVEPVNATANDWFYDYIIERNWLRFGAFTPSSTVSAITVTGSRGTVRNNLINMTGPTQAARTGILVQQENVEPAPLEIRVYNNTIFESDVGVGATRGIWVHTTATDTYVNNNLCWFDVAAGSPTCLLNQGVNTTASANSSDAQSTGMYPLFDGPLTSPRGFRIGTGSYAASGGVATFPPSNSDFFQCDDTTANEHIGAFVPRTRARCRGVAGP